MTNPDNGGQRGADNWAELSRRLHAVTVPNGADLTGYHADGGDLRAWLKAPVGNGDPETAHKLADARQWAAEVEAHSLPGQDAPSWPAWYARVEADLIG